MESQGGGRVAPTTAVLVVVAKSPGTPPPALPAGTATSLGFEPRHRLDWSDRTGAVRVVAWSDDPAGWDEHDGDLTLVAGDLRRRGRTASGVDVLRDEAPADVAAARDELRGVFAAAVLTARGDGVVLTDPIGHRCLYHGESGTTLVLSSRAALAAEALAGGSAPPRDGLGMCWLPFMAYRVGTRSGYEGIGVLRPGASLQLTGGRATWAHHEPFAVRPDDPRRNQPIEELAEEVLDDVADSLRTLLARPSAEPPVLSLTGGKDSRLVLAAALRAGLAHDLRYETTGPPGLADVQVACELAERYRLDHEVRFLERQEEEPWGDRFRRFTELTAGMVNGWDLSPGAGVDDELHLTGLCGELLRSCTKLRARMRSPEGLAEAFSVPSLSRLGLVQPDVARVLHEELAERIATEPSPEADPFDRVQRHYAGSRMRFTRLGPREELAGGRRLHPLYSPLAIQAAMAIDSRDRNSEVLVGAMLRLGSEGLVDHRFADSGWDERARRRLGLPPATVSAPAAKATPLVASLFAAGGSDRLDLLHAVFADAGNPAWDRLDRPAALAALARFHELTRRERHELFGAATAAVWLAGERATTPSA